MWWMGLREFNIHLCFLKLQWLKKNNFQNFFKKFSIFNFRFRQNLNAPMFPKYSHDHQKIFSQILVGNFTISQFQCLFFLSSPVGWSWAIYSGTCPGACWSFALIFCGSPAYCTNSGYTAAPVWCPDLSPCSGDGILAHFSGCLSCWSVRARLQNFRAHKLKAIISEYLRFWARRTPTETRKPCKAYKRTIDIVKAIICLHCQIVKVRKEAGRIRLFLFIFFYIFINAI